MSQPSSPTRYKLTVAYKGDGYKGWQIQKNGLTIQETLENTLLRILQKKIPVTGAGRTDSGVHAEGQVAHITLDTKIEPIKLLKGLNGLLPPDIRILSIEEVALSFHARFSAKEKIYCYKLYRHKIHNPFHRRDSLHYPHPISIDAIQEAIPHFLGTKNFKSFTNEAHNVEKDYCKTLYNIEIKEEGEILSFTFSGSGFLYKMVRNLSATLLAIGTNRLPLSSLPALFAAEDRRVCPGALPALGLTLIKVVY
ncbi:MAG: tRNA pseudouridine(38-40) synthase TruA [Verrucomicrobia bacterium]|nr:tRNA pseudouridine(38-40) synthase TruA [Verrucomicrobiota bacterium]